MATTFVLAAVASVALLVSLSALFSSSETAIFSLPQEWFDSQAETGEARALVLKRLRDDPHRLLVTVLVGNNVVNIAVSSVVTVLATGYLEPGFAVVVTTVFTSFVVLVFGEIVPKAYGLDNSETWALKVARPLSLVGWLLYPVILFFDVVTRRLSSRLSAETDIEKQYLD